MSGFAVCYGREHSSVIDAMMQKISHRGNYIQGTQDIGNALLGQNYLRADTYGASQDANVPITDPADKQLTICYDGQINDCRELCGRLGINEGPFMEERLLLHLYRNHQKDMFEYLGNAIFAFVITDGQSLFAARDLFGIKTLFFAKNTDRILFSSELKGVVAAAGDVLEFPAGHTMDEKGATAPFGDVSADITFYDKDLETMKTEIRTIIEKHVRSTIDFERPTGGLLSGGMDSSVINHISSGILREKQGNDARLKTFAIGVGESGDIQNARLMAKHIGSEHFEISVTIEDLIAAVPDVIYYLESFDPSLVRSSIANYLISRYAAKEHGVEVLLSGEGGDEMFCGYTYLKEVPYEDMVEKQLECLGYLHNNASLRLDRMNQCNSVKIVAPLISGELLDYALHVPPQYKQHEEDGTRVEKWIFRKAYEGILPEQITSRLKQEFSQGSGAAAVLPAYFEEKVSDSDYSAAKARFPIIRSKEEYFYFKLFSEYFGEDSAIATVGQWVEI